MKYLSICFILLCLAGCGKHYLGVLKYPVDRNSLASTFARSPDPFQNDPPRGEKLYVTWRLPYAMDPSDYEIALTVIYRDLTEERITYPIKYRMGAFSFELTGPKFTEKKGFYSYKAEILTKEGQIVDTWQHIMWVKILNLG